MKTAYRTASHAKRRLWCDPMASIHVLAANTEQPEANANRIMVALRVAYERLKNGSQDHEAFDRVAAAFNVGLVRAEAIDPLAEETMLSGVHAMVMCDTLCSRHGHYGFTGPGLVAMNDAMDLYEGILRLSTPRQMLDALDESARRMRQGVVMAQAA